MAELRTPCSIWPRSLYRNGYGQATLRGRKTGAHRLAWTIANGNVPDGLCVLHRCDNRACINVEHLFLGTKRDNTQDMIAKGRLVIGKRLRGEQARHAKMTEAGVRQVRAQFDAGISMRALARQTGLSRPAIRAICKRETWKHVC